MTPCKVLDVLSFGAGTGCSRMGEVFPSGLPIERTFATIIRSARYARRYAKTLGAKIDSATSTSTKGIARVTRCHVHIAKNGNAYL